MDYSIRDASFHNLCKTLLAYASDGGTKKADLNIEFGYGGARLMDCRQLGATTTEQLYAALHTLLKEGNNVNLMQAQVM